MPLHLESDGNAPQTYITQSGRVSDVQKRVDMRQFLYITRENILEPTSTHALEPRLYSS